VATDTGGPTGNSEAATARHVRRSLRRRKVTKKIWEWGILTKSLVTKLSERGFGKVESRQWTVMEIEKLKYLFKNVFPQYVSPLSLRSVRSFAVKIFPSATKTHKRIWETYAISTPTLVLYQTIFAESNVGIPACGSRISGKNARVTMLRKTY